MRAALALLVLAACDGTTSDPGLTAKLQVAGAEFRPGPFPDDEGGPATIGLSPTHSSVVVGRLFENVTAALAVNARTAVIGLDGFDGSWLVVADAPDSNTPDLATVKVKIGVAADFEIGAFSLVMAAADRDGRFGPATAAELIAIPEPPPPGELVFELVWQGNADLDLHVVDALGGEGFADDPNTFDPPIGEPVDPNEFKHHGILDHDGNKDCRREATPNEHITWDSTRCTPEVCRPPASGEYIVRVDTPSMCGDASVAWLVVVYVKQSDGSLAPVASARGVSTAEDVLQPRGRGAGVLALRLTL